MGKRRFGIAEVKRQDKRKLLGSSALDKRLVIKSAEDLPPVSAKLQAAYDENRQVAVFMSMSSQETVRVWFCHYCRRLINLAESEQPGLDPEADLVDCVRCGISKMEKMGTFGSDLSP